MRGGDSAAALARAKKAVAAHPQDARLRFLEGVILMDQHRDAEALAVFQRMTEDFPELPDPYNNIAVLEVRAGHLLLARTALETALRNDPDHLAARTNLGDVDLMLAIEAWQQAAKARPDDGALQRKLALARQILATTAK
ncbi:MAG: tetratricopeptide repeat protein [Burkholderiales bacterium]|nr:tetratricopeptide repeat protein [Burkholderiales bacterium]MDE2452425.1 tetratricopeptide repeat protein [Burkholderiales bacterium]